MIMTIIGPPGGTDKACIFILQQFHVVKLLFNGL